MEIRSEYVQLSVSDGTTMRAWTARPKEEGSHPGLLVFQEAFGVNAHIRDIAGRFAREGFITVAPELFHRTGAGFEGRYDDFPSTMPHMKASGPRMTGSGARSEQVCRSPRLVTAWADERRFLRASHCRSRRRFLTMEEELRQMRRILACSGGRVGFRRRFCSSGAAATNTFCPSTFER
jgi:Dienelactone hydrolase family